MLKKKKQLNICEFKQDFLVSKREQRNQNWTWRVIEKALEFVTFGPLSLLKLPVTEAAAAVGEKLQKTSRR